MHSLERVSGTQWGIYSNLNPKKPIQTGPRMIMKKRCEALNKGK